MNLYKVLNNQRYENGEFEIVPIRFQDIYTIMKWRNEQIYHLRQNKFLTSNDQDYYFSSVVKPQFEEANPNQVLFSYLKNGECIGYGGLVHINWVDLNAEISFIMDTELEKEYFCFHWEMFLSLIQKVAFEDIGFHKIFTYAFDLRPKLYHSLENSNFIHEATLKDHCFFQNEFISVLIHSKINDFQLRKAELSDLNTTFKWAINPSIRKYSFNKENIKFEEHENWFINKISDNNCYYLIFENVLNTKLGSIRLDISENNAIISYLIDELYFGKGYGKILINLVIIYIKENNIPIKNLIGFVMEDNLPSVRIFEKLGFQKEHGETSLKFIKKLT